MQMLIASLNKRLDQLQSHASHVQDESANLRQQVAKLHAQHDIWRQQNQRLLHPVAHPVTHPVADPVAHPVADPVAHPVADPVAQTSEQHASRALTRMSFSRAARVTSWRWLPCSVCARRNSPLAAK